MYGLNPGVSLHVCRCRLFRLVKSQEGQLILMLSDFPTTLTLNMTIATFIKCQSTLTPKVLHKTLLTWTIYIYKHVNIYHWQEYFKIILKLVRVENFFKLGKSTRESSLENPWWTELILVKICWSGAPVLWSISKYVFMIYKVLMNTE